MKRFALAAILMLPCLPLHADDAAPATTQTTPAKPKSRSFDEFIQEVLQNGRDTTVNSDASASVGLSGEIAAKAVRYRAAITPDKKGHYFYVLYKTTEEKKSEPTNLIWITEKIQMVGADKIFDQMEFLVSMDGKLKAVSSFNGKAHETPSVKLNPASAKVKEAFAFEKKFYLADSIALQYSAK